MEDFGIRATEPSGCATAVLINVNGLIPTHLHPSNRNSHCVSFLCYCMLKAGLITLRHLKRTDYSYLHWKPNCIFQAH